MRKHFITKDSYEERIRPEVFKMNFEINMTNNSMLQKIEAYAKANAPLDIPDIGSSWFSKANPNTGVTIVGIDLSVRVAYVKTFTSQRYNIQYSSGEYVMSFSNLISNYSRSLMTL